MLLGLVVVFSLVTLASLLTAGLTASPGEASATCPSGPAIRGSSTMGFLASTIRGAFDSSFGGSSVAASLHPGYADWEGNDQAISDLRSGNANVAQVSRLWDPSEYTGLYVYRVAKSDNGLPDLWLAVRENSAGSTGTNRIDDTNAVYADDWGKMQSSMQGGHRMERRAHRQFPTGTSTSMAIPI
jgi:hypothetical protein